MRKLNQHRFNDCNYSPCNQLDSINAGYRWYREVLHPSGMIWDERHSPKFRTLSECRDDSKDVADSMAYLKQQAAEFATYTE